MGGSIDWKPWSEGDSLVAPAGLFRVLAFHIDFDQRPTSFADVASLDLAKAICGDLQAYEAGNVDYAIAMDGAGVVVASGRPY